MSVRFEAIVNITGLDRAIWRRNARRAMREFQADIRGDFNEGVRTWSGRSRPRMTEAFIENDGGITAEVKPVGEIYTYVHEGTRPHRITPKRAKRLRFQRGYQAKTSPGRLQASGGGSYGPTVFSKGVNHPGFKGRKFSQQIVRKRRPDFAARIQDAVDRTISESGHGV